MIVADAPTIAEAAIQIAERVAGYSPTQLRILDPTDPRHGSRAGYDAHRAVDDEACDACKRGAAAYQARRELLASRGVQLRFHPCSVQRRLQALAVMGYTFMYLDNEVGVACNSVAKMATAPRRYIRRATYEKVCAAYERLSMTPAPETTGKERRAAAMARKIAAERGWVPPMAWDEGALDDPTATPYVPTDWGIRGGLANGAGGYPVDHLQAKAATLTDCLNRRTGAHAAAREMGVPSKDALEHWVARHDGYCGILRRMYGDLCTRDIAIITSQKVA